MPDNSGAGTVDFRGESLMAEEASRESRQASPAIACAAVSCVSSKGSPAWFHAFRSGQPRTAGPRCRNGIDAVLAAAIAFVSAKQNRKVVE